MDGGVGSADHQLHSSQPGASTPNSLRQSTSDVNFAFALPVDVHQWKTISNKRRRSPNPKLPQEKQMKLTNYWLGAPVTTSSNRFQELETEDNPPPTEVNLPKPPPIMLKGVQNIAPLIEQLNIVAKENYQIKTSGENVTIHSRSKEYYSAITKLLVEKKTMFHSFPFKDARAFRVVLKNVHHSADTEEIKEALKEKGHDVRNIHNILNRAKKPQPMFFVDLEPKANNREIYQIQLLSNMRLNFEPPRQKREIPQCMKCQRYGHTKHYCHHPARCVKCAGNHETAICPRNSKDRDVLCVLCEGNHPANYRGCVIYKELQAKRYPPMRNRNADSQQAAQPPPRPSSSTRPGLSYAQVTREQNQQQQFLNNLNQPENSQPSSDMCELKKMMKGLMEQVGTMLNLLTTLIVKMN